MLKQINSRKTGFSRRLIDSMVWNSQSIRLRERLDGFKERPEEFGETATRYFMRFIYFVV